jgi:ATP-dependent RNA helicase DDX51/DBP6
LQKHEFGETFPIQTKLIPMMLNGDEKYEGDICVSAPTGSGKTLGYLLPVIEALKESLDTRLRAIVVVPTRELVTQACQVVVSTATGTGVHVGTAVGTNIISHEQDLLIEQDQEYDPVEYQRLCQIAERRIQTGFHENDSIMIDVQNLLPDYKPIFRSKVDILICTPGRLVEHIRSTRGFSLQHLQYLIIDEADKLLDESFQEWVDVILNSVEQSSSKSLVDQTLSQIPCLAIRNKLQKVILSATMTRDIGKLAVLKLRRPALVAVASQSEDISSQAILQNVENAAERIELPQSLSEVAIPVGDGSEKPLYLLQLIHSILGEEAILNNESARDLGNSVPKILVFVNNTEDAMRLRHIILALRPDMSKSLEALTKVSSKSSRKTLSAFQSGKFNVLLATDRASRGLDVSDLTDVVSYDMPKSLPDYVHRVGRTARADKSGTAWTFFTDTQARWFWNAIARSEQVYRSQGKVKRSMIDILTDEKLKERYEKALQDLKTAVITYR